MYQTVLLSKTIQGYFVRLENQDFHCENGRKQYKLTQKFSRKNYFCQFTGNNKQAVKIIKKKDQSASLKAVNCFQEMMYSRLSNKPRKIVQCCL